MPAVRTRLTSSVSWHWLYHGPRRRAPGGGLVFRVLVDSVDAEVCDRSVRAVFTRTRESRANSRTGCWECPDFGIRFFVKAQKSPSAPDRFDQGTLLATTGALLECQCRPAPPNNRLSSRNGSVITSMMASRVAPSPLLVRRTGPALASSAPAKTTSSCQYGPRRRPGNTPKGPAHHRFMARPTGNCSRLLVEGRSHVRRVHETVVACKMSDAVCSGASQFGKCPDRPNQYSSAPGNSAWARGA